MFLLASTIAVALGMGFPEDTKCLTPDQDRTLKTTIMSIDAAMQVTATSLNIAAMWKDGLQKEQLLNASKIITAVDQQFVVKMIGITEETCGTCSQITKGVQDIVHDLEDTLTASVPDWKTNPIYSSVTTILNTILNIIPHFCPESLAVLTDGDQQCLTPDQDKQLKTAINSIDAAMQTSVAALNIAAIWKTGVQQEQIQNASRIIDAVDKQFVTKMIGITEETCGTCSQVTKGVKDIATDLENTLTASVPDWKTNPIYSSVTLVVNLILNIVPNFCPSTLALRAFNAINFKNC